MTGSLWQLYMVIGIIVLVICWAIWAMNKSRTPLAGDDEHH